MEQRQISTGELEYIQAIRNNDRAGIRVIYQEIFPSIKSWVLRNNGNSEDAEDVLQDGLMVVFTKLSDPDFRLTSSFKTYLTSICRFIWLRKLKKKERFSITIGKESGLIETDTVEAVLLEEEKQLLFRKYFERLGSECRTVLTLFFQGVKMKDIAEQMGYVEKFAKVKKHLCKKKLFEKIQKDQKYRELTS